jgi:glycosyltransferase involved in cell wall biosynthesis
MKICIEAQPFVADRTGVGRYTYNLVRSFSGMKLEDDFSVLYFNARGNFREQEMIRKNPRMTNREIKYIPGFLAYNLWTYLSFPPVELYAGFHDLYHFTNFTTLPVRRGKVIVSIYDATFKRYPQFMEKTNAARLERLMERTLFESDGIIVISEFIKKEMSSFFQYPEKRIYVTHLGIEEKFRKEDDGEKLKGVRKKYGIEEPFILHTGTLEPRKNITYLVRAFNEAAKKEKHHLVIVGRLGWSYQAILKEIERSPYKDRIHHLGFVEDDDLPLLYSAADLFVFPSLYEGFGFPPLEAMACGLPVISSDRGSLSEVLRDGAALFNPEMTEPEGLAEMIVELLHDENKRNFLVEKGKAVSGKYTWENTARMTLDAYRETLSS